MPILNNNKRNNGSRTNSNSRTSEDPIKGTKTLCGDDV